MKLMTLFRQAEIFVEKKLSCGIHDRTHKGSQDHPFCYYKNQ